MSYDVENRKLDVKNIKKQCFILALFVRSDGRRFLLGDGAYEFKDSQLHYNANDIENTVIEVQGGDGALLSGQVERSSVQEFDGYVGDGGVSRKDVEYYRDEFINFFRKGYYYRVIYIYSDNEIKMRERGYLVDAPEVKELWRVHPEYHVALNFEDVNYYSYFEDDNGDEVFSKSAILTPENKVEDAGGLVWAETLYNNENVESDGVYWDDIGAVWEDGNGSGDNIIKVETVKSVFPITTIKGFTANPVISNITTGQTLSYNGVITETQTLVIDINKKTAKLNGVNVLGNVQGDWLELVDGNNYMVYTTQGQGQDAVLQWREIVG